MATVTFFTRISPQADPNKKINVRVRFRHGKHLNLYAKSGLQVLPNQFSNKTHAINKQVKYKDKDDDKDYLHNLENAILDAYKELKAEPTSDWLNEVIDMFRFPDKYKKEDTPTLFTFIKQFIKEAPYTPRRINDRLPSKKTLVDYEVTFENLKEFAQAKGKNDFSFKEINKKMYTDFKNFLTIKKGYALNTVGKKIKVFKTFLHDAAEREYIEETAFKDFKKLAENKEAIYLSEEELQTIYELDLKGAIADARDLFLVGCWTGLRYSDWEKIAEEKVDGDKITIIQEKTGNEVIIPVLQVTRAILNKHGGKLPRVVSNQKFNAYLKEIGKAAGINKLIPIKRTIGGKTVKGSRPKYELITTHTARRTFATNMYKRKYPIKSIMNITGHETESVFMKYIKLSKEESADAMLEKERELIAEHNQYMKVAK
jgi:integrase